MRRMKPFLRTGRPDRWFAVVSCLLVGWITGAVAGVSQTQHYQPPVTHRLVKTINRDWTFNYFPDPTADAAGCQTPTFDDSNWTAVAVPHTWQTYETTGEVHPFIHDASEKDDPYWWRGWGWYRKHFSIAQGQAGRKIFVEFDAVQTCGGSSNCAR